MTFKDRHIDLIMKTGGNILESKSKNIYIIEPGVMITQKTKLTTEANLLFQNLNLNMTCFPHAEFNSRLTYMAFKDEKNKDSSYLSKLVNEYGHLSIFNDVYVTVLITGVSLEAELEFVAHNEATIARLTSSRTSAQDKPLYVVSSQEEIDYLEKILKIEKPNNILENNKDSKELINKLNPASKAVSFTVSMSVKNWHKTFIGRFSNEGVELEMRMICSKILSELRKDYSFILKTEKEYYEMNNLKKD